ncbi:hypothetical protein U8527_21665 [Kordia algicida OT-1]|uniref:Uncharacterized protein n=1 Tax=Kordia algicida OT-1 TaxID=391587 RepID=A9DQ61_9FLAO|nr:hypothetical protein [Kordia algicida]EDP96582.1 hypothetical protein KAOT1_15503 [Kordia algicida OT-1]
MKKVIQSMFCLLLLTSSMLTAQNSSDKKGMSIDKQLVFVLNDTNINEIQSTYTVDITDLGFKSSEDLNDFCTIFSFDFHQLKGDFASKKIIMTLDKKSLIDRKFTLLQVNEHFSSISKRMRYTYNFTKQK